MNGIGIVRERQPEGGQEDRTGPGAGGAGPDRLLYGLDGGTWFWPWECGQAKDRRYCGLPGERMGTADLGLPPADLAGVAPPCARWTCLQLDLHDILFVYLNRRYSHLKSVRLCANLLVRSLYTSDLCFNPGEGYTPRPALTLHVGCSNPITATRFSAQERLCHLVKMPVPCYL